MPLPAPAACGRGFCLPEHIAFDSRGTPVERDIERHPRMIKQCRLTIIPGEIADRERAGIAAFANAAQDLFRGAERRIDKRSVQAVQRVFKADSCGRCGSWLRHLLPRERSLDDDSSDRPGRRRIRLFGFERRQRFRIRQQRPDPAGQDQNGSRNSSGCKTVSIPSAAFFARDDGQPGRSFALPQSCPILRDCGRRNGGRACAPNSECAQLLSQDFVLPDRIFQLLLQADRRIRGPLQGRVFVGERFAKRSDQSAILVFGASRFGRASHVPARLRRPSLALRQPRNRPARLGILKNAQEGIHRQFNRETLGHFDGNYFFAETTGAPLAGPREGRRYCSTASAQESRLEPSDT